MSTISRRSFLKLAGVTAVATAGASMLTGCSIVRNVTIIPVLNGEVVQGETPSIPLPGFINDYTVVFNQALSLVAPIVMKKYTNIPGADKLHLDPDNDFRDANNIPSCRVFTDPETGKDMMYLAVKCNVINGTIAIRTTDGLHNHFITDVSLPDTLSELPKEYVQKLLDKEAANWPDCTITLADRADNCKVVKSVDGKSFKVDIYVDLKAK